MRRHACFDSNQAPRHIGEPGCDPAAGNLLPQNDGPLVVEAGQISERFSLSGSGREHGRSIPFCDFNCMAKSLPLSTNVMVALVISAQTFSLK